MIRVTLTAEQAQAILQANDAVEFCDPSGGVIGHLVPQSVDFSKLEIIGEEPSDEELDRIANSNDRRYTTAEVLTYLHNLETL